MERASHRSCKNLPQPAPFSEGAFRIVSDGLRLHSQEAIQSLIPKARGPDLLLTLLGHLALGGFDEAITRLRSFNQDLLALHATALLAV